MDLSIVMSTCNRAADTQRFLESLETIQCRAGIQWEVIVVDNNSTDATPTVVSDYIPRAGFPLRLVKETRKGRSAGINAGINAAAGRYLALTDDDIIVTPNWAQEIIDHFDRHDNAGCIGGMVKLFNPEDAPITIKTDPTPAIIDRSNFTPHDTPVLGCNTALRRSVLDQIGLFDLELGVGTPTRSGEDVDLVYRILNTGMEVHYAPSIVVYHNHGRRTAAQIKHLKKGYGYGLGAFYAKYFRLSDRQVMRWAYWDIRTTVRRHLPKILFNPKSREEIRQIYYTLVGTALYLRHHEKAPPKPCHP